MINYARGASTVKSCQLLAAPTVVYGFGIAYGVLLTRHPPGVSLPTLTEGSVSVADAILLSLGVATTGSFLDFELSSMLSRRLALIEMLLLISLAGATLYSAATSALEALREDRHGEQ